MVDYPARFMRTWGRRSISCNAVARPCAFPVTGRQAVTRGRGGHLQGQRGPVTHRYQPPRGEGLRGERRTVAEAIQPFVASHRAATGSRLTLAPRADLGRLGDLPAIAMAANARADMAGYTRLAEPSLLARPPGRPDSACRGSAVTTKLLIQNVTVFPVM